MCKARGRLSRAILHHLYVKFYDGIGQDSLLPRQITRIRIRSKPSTSVWVAYYTELEAQSTHQHRDLHHHPGNRFKLTRRHHSEINYCVDTWNRRLHLSS